jgi:ATP-binding cassette subfamily B protein
MVFMTLLSAAVTVAGPMIFKYLIDTLDEVLTANVYEIDHHIKENQQIYCYEVNADLYYEYTQSSIVDCQLSIIHRIVWILLTVGFVRLIASFFPAFRGSMNLVFEYIFRKKYFKSMLEKDYKFFLQFRTGDLVTRLTNDIWDWPKIGWFVCSGIFRALSSFVTIVFCMIAMFLLNWQLTLFVTIPLPMIIVVYYFASDKLHKRFKKNQEAVSEINNQLEMTFSGIKIIKAYVTEDKYSRFFDMALQNRFKTEMKLVKINTVLHMLYEYIDWICLILVIMIGGYMVVMGSITIGTFVAFYLYLAMLVWPLLDLPNLFISGKQSFVCIDRLEEIKDFPVTTYAQTNDNEQIKAIRLSSIESIKFENITFKYDDRNINVLDDVSFLVKKGEKVLIMGKSGEGKSTILGLLAGLLIPQSGIIYINNIPINEIDICSLRELIGYVPQEPSLFTGTIKENVLFGAQSKDLPNDDIYYDTLIEAIQMKEEIAGFRDGDQTKLGYKGLSLSGGQKQRVAIARALYKKPELLILDDITASLDAKKEELLWVQISHIFKDLTAFIVSHRLSSLRYADNVIFLENGKIAAHGKHEDLLILHHDYKDFIKHHYK